MLSLFKSAKDTSNTRPLKLSAAISTDEHSINKEVILTLTGSLVAGGDSGNAVVEDSGHMDVVPFFSCEGVGTIFNNEYCLTDEQRKLTSSSFGPSF